MASFQEGPLLEIYHGHKREQSQDSGAYIDWNSEDSASPTGNLDAKGEFVTVVAVESNSGVDETSEVSPFVTVLEINDEDGKVKGKSTINANEDIEEEVLVYRLPGERLGFGLKFEGGTNTAETVKRLFIQSSAPDSPASRAECSWGALTEGDEIIKIDGHQVKDMTRLDCVRCLKESSVVIKLFVRHPGEKNGSYFQSSTSPLVISAEMKKKVPPPPPIPPRKIPRKVMTPLQKDEISGLGPPEGFCDPQPVPVPKVRSLQTASDENSSSSKGHSKSNAIVPPKQDLADVSRKISKRSVFDLKHIPPEPEVYLDILAQEEVKNNCESESDDTGSTISTVMGLTNSSFSDLRSNTSSYCDSTTTSTPTSTPSTPILDAAKVLSPSETNDFLFTKMISDKCQDSLSYDEKVCSDDNTPLQPPLSFQDAPLSYGNEEIKVSLSEAIDPTKNSSEDLQILDDAEATGTSKSNGKLSGKKSSLIPRLAKSIGLISAPPKPSPRKEAEKSRSKKRPPPPPPPSRTDRPQAELDGKSLKSSIPYLKKKKTNQKKTKTDKVTYETEPFSESLEEVPDEEDQNGTLSWPVPYLVNRGQELDLSDLDAKCDVGDLSLVSDDSETEGNRDAHFTFQWGSSKHLETIGEDEEDGCCNDDGTNGQNGERTHGGVQNMEDEDRGNDKIVTLDVTIVETEEGITNTETEHEDGTTVDASVPSQAVTTTETLANDTTAEDFKSSQGPVMKSAGVRIVGLNLKIPPDGSVIHEKGTRAKEEKKLGDNYGLAKVIPDKLPDEVASDINLSNGGMKENMVPTVTAAVGLAPPPTFSRLPPDGHEFPQNYREETMPGKLREESALLYDEELKSDLPPLPTSEPPKYSFRLESNLEILPNKKGDVLYVRPSRPSFWRQDEKSEKSVRDKIAMFSSVPDSTVAPFCTGKLSKYKSSDDVFYDDEAECVKNGKNFSRSIVSIDKIGGLNVRGYSKKFPFNESTVHPRSLDYANRTQSSMDLTSSSSSAYSSSCSPDSSLSSTTSSYLGYSSTLPRKSSRGEATKNDATGQKHSGITRTTSFSTHGRSQSLLDINPSPYKSRFKVDGNAYDEHKQSSLNLLIEQRRKNLSKLRGLVIPDKFPDVTPSQPIFDLPEIKSRDLLLTPKVPSPYKEESRNSQIKWESPNPSVNLNSPAWNASNVPKYSPAFKRKSISIYSSCTSPVRKETLNNNGEAKPPAKPPRSMHRYGQAEVRNTDAYSPGRKVRNTDAGRSEEDSDNDSAVSSSRSSISHGFSPPSSPLLDNQSAEELRNQVYTPSLGEKSPLMRTLSSETTASCASNTSTLTSGSQGSTCSNEKRILKAQSVEAINRKNVLASAKYSRGFDAKSGSPLIQRKFIAFSESDDSSPENPSVRKSSQTTNYKLPSEVTHTKSMDVKIAFMNDVDEICPKKKLTKTESVPSCTAAIAEQKRRTSMPFMGNHFNSEEEWSPKKAENCHAALAGRPSSESLRSRASSVDTVVENVRENDIGYRLKTARNSIETDLITKRNVNHESCNSAVKAVDLYGKAEKEGAPKDATSNRNQRSVSVNDIRKAFEKIEVAPQSNGRGTKAINPIQFNGNHVRVSSLDSTNSEDSCVFGPGQYGSSSNLHREQFGSITSLASSTSLISPQELQLLIDEANQTLEESGGCTGGSSAANHDVLVVILHRDTTGGSIGITLAGGADYESKEITVHKVLTGSPADRDGRIQKGDRILSINGKSMKGVTHRESLAILKSPRPEVVLVVSRPKSDSNCDPVINDENIVTTSVRSNLLSNRPPRILEGTTLNDSGDSVMEDVARGPPVTFMLVKDGAGLGFSLEGGKDSPLGDKPLIIKKIFTGGAAEKCGHLKAGDEILNVNGIDVTLMSRIEAWKLMKRIPDGNVSITVRRQVENRSGTESEQ